MGRKPKKPNLTEEQKSLIIQEFIAAGITKTENGRLTDRTGMKRCMGGHKGWLLAHRWNSSAEEAWQTRSW